MNWKGSSNIDDGFVLDMRKINQINILVKDQTIQLGPGAVWKDVYAKMASLNITTTGARINEVGVGGFLMGGEYTIPRSCQGRRLIFLARWHKLCVERQRIWC